MHAVPPPSLPYCDASIRRGVGYPNSLCKRVTSPYLLPCHVVPVEGVDLPSRGFDLPPREFLQKKEDANMNAHALCDDGSCGLCPRCLAGDEGVFVPGEGKRGPKPSPRPDRPVEPAEGYASAEEEHEADMARDAWE